jgi:hypothetical protein
MSSKKRPCKSHRLLVEVTDQTCCVKIPANIGSHKSSASLIGDDRLLESLLAPVDPEWFMEACFRSCAVHIPGSVKEGSRFDDIREALYDLDPLTIFQNSSSDAIFVWIRTPESEQIHSIEVSDPNSALALYNAGNATYCRAPPSLEQALISSLLADTGLGCGQYDPTGQSMSCLGRGEVEVFLSTRGHFTDWHFDFQENFTLQLSGVKEWKLQKSIVKHPLRGCTPHYRSPEAVEPQIKAARLAAPNFIFGKPEIGKNAVGAVETVILHPGDVLYHPAGIWHQVRVVEEGVSINISLMATNFATITCQALQHFLMKRDEWRQCLVGGPGRNVVDTLKSLLKELPAIVKQFEQNVSAECILPPALSRNFGPLGADSDEPEDDVGDGGDESNAIDADRFVFPASSSDDRAVSRCQQGLTGATLAINPLANIMDERDIRDYYYSKNEVANKRDTKDSSDVCILNVNFAGTESQESCVRVRLLSCNWEKLMVVLDRKLIVPSELYPLVDCLLFYGYLYRNA